MSEVIQQQLITARKNQILDAAAVVFASKGFHPTTTKDIAKQAGISEGTIYNYFDNKPALLLGIFERMKETVIREHVPPAPSELDFHTFIRYFLYQPLMSMKQDNFALFRIIVSEMMVNEDLRELYYQHILKPTLVLAEAYFAEQVDNQGLNPASIKLTIRALSSMVLGLMLQYVMGDEIVISQWDYLPDLLADLTVNGLKEDHR